MKSNNIATNKISKIIMFIIFVKCHSQMNYLIFKVETSIRRTSARFVAKSIDGNSHHQLENALTPERKEKINKQFSNS